MDANTPPTPNAPSDNFGRNLLIGLLATGIFLKLNEKHRWIDFESETLRSKKDKVDNYALGYSDAREFFVSHHRHNHPDCTRCPH